jgi:aspartate racemase
MKHIGIAACSSPGAALCYQTIIASGLAELGNHRHPEVSMHTPSLSDYMVHLEDGKEDWVAAANVVVDSVDKLRKAGADFAICPDNTIHEGIDLVRDNFSLPFLHIADVVAAEARKQGMTRILILGTRYTAKSSYYDRALSAQDLEQVMPNADEVAEIDRVIWEELYWNTIKPQSLAYYQKVIDRHKAKGCDGVVLGCTEIPLLVTAENSSIPILDSTRLLARAALREAID